LLLLNASLRGDDHDAVLDIKGQRFAWRLIAVLGNDTLKNPLDGGLHVGAAKINRDGGLLWLKPNFLQLGPVDQEINLGLVLEVIASLLQSWTRGERHRDRGGLNLVPCRNVDFRLAVAARAVIRLADAAVTQLLPVFWISHQCVGGARSGTRNIHALRNRGLKRLVLKTGEPVGAALLSLGKANIHLRGVQSVTKRECSGVVGIERQRAIKNL